MSTYGTAHLYAQSFWHDFAYLMGDEEALIQLRAAIDAALEVGQATTELVANDGEGYQVFVLRHESRPEAWDGILRPYTDECAMDSREDALGPWDLLDFDHMAVIGSQDLKDYVADIAQRQAKRKVQP